MAKAKEVSGKVKVIASPNLGGVSFHTDIGLTEEQYQELKYGSGKAEISQQAFDWLYKYGHVTEDK